MSLVQTVNYVIRGLYRDSVQLMQVSERIRKIPGVLDAAVVMATPANKDSLIPLGLLTDEGKRAGPNDIIIACKTTGKVEEVIEEAKKILFEIKPSTAKYFDVEDAVKANPDAKYASISIPGKYVEALANKLLDRGVNLFIFSDHVPLESEISLKQKAASKDLLVMGPEAGTAIISGVGFGFANNVARGNVGVVASAGSGIQEFVTILDSFGIGTSHAIGVGGRDLTKQVGGIMTRKALQSLVKDEQTKVIALIAKQSDVDVVKIILEQEKISKPLLLCLLGYEKQITQYPQTPTLHGLVLKVASALSATIHEHILDRLKQEQKALKQQLIHLEGYPRAFYSGGTLATETAYIWTQAGLQVYTNLGASWTQRLENPYYSRQSTVVDYGSEEFTEGRPHPIIDPTLRNKRVVSELSSPETSTVAIDLIIGFGAPDNILEKTVAEIGPAALQHRQKKMVVRVVGTERDVQWPQVKMLENYGILTPSSNALAAIFTAACKEGDSSFIDQLVERFIQG